MNPISNADLAAPFNFAISSAVNPFANNDSLLMNGAPAKLACPTAKFTIASFSACVYPKFFNACGTDWLIILKYPPPDNFLNFTKAKSGSTPVVSQSITKPIVPVGAITVVCAFL